MSVSQLSKVFRTFAERECTGSSPLYEYLSLKIADDSELIALASHAKQGQPIPNLLFGAVHFLLLTGKDHKLKEFYPSIVDNPSSVRDSFPYFKDFCLNHSSEIKDMIQNKLVQTNEVRRCAYLFPVFQYIFDTVHKPLAQIEIGTSAGLQLLWDKYSYSYGSNEIYGNRNADVHLYSIIKKGKMPFLKDNIPPVANRIGVDLHTVDLKKETEYLWLNALIWPEHHERRVLFQKASRCVKENHLTLIDGDGVELLPNLTENISNDYCICVFHTHVANQMPEDAVNKLLHHVKMIGENREIFHIYNNIEDRDLHLQYYVDGTEYVKRIGQTDGHGRWFTWELPKRIL
ncbi:DUF2332 domain-containing protein [Gracilibacillus caseinilyticus]|uniref:DUF2332 domain-containing protein n=1 Tax=Gracilibacillus caseinilyticus TaxID=2932256 RepID=A0ABY4EYL0_9BACI|nr:DUF2332 domain-containing protein [Gracilibacillus caseinilyticus]UOQ48948.1 DUF2332 domain-containing protein [Gracilibacillus caseinilyticus]